MLGKVQEWPLQQAESGEGTGGSGGEQTASLATASDAGGGVAVVDPGETGGESRSGDAPPAIPDHAPPPETPRTPARQETRQPERRQTEPSQTEAAQADTLIENWRDLADPAYRTDPVLGKYKTVGEALKALVHNERLLGNAIQIPREGASEVQWRNIFEKLGCPKHPGEYVIRDPDMGQDDDGQAKSLAPQFVVSLLDVCHQAGLNAKQAQAFVDFAARTVVQSEQIHAGEMAMQKAQAERELFEAFGGDSATMIQKAMMAVQRMGEGRYGGGAYAQRAVEKLRNSPLGNDVDVIAMLANVWDNFSEGSFIESSGGGGLTSRDQLMADIAALGQVMNDERRPYDERVTAQKKQYRLFQDLNTMTEAAERRQSGFRR